MATVIKAGSNGSHRRRLVTVDLADHLREARAVVAEAQREAARIVAQAKLHAERLHAEAREAGYRSGHERGLEEGRATGHEQAHGESRERFETEQASLVQTLSDAVEALNERKEEIAIAARRDVLELVVAIASKLTFRIGAIHHESAQANLQRAVELVGRRTNLTVRVHPRDAAAMRTFAESWPGDVGESGAVRWIEDEAIAPGGCRVSNDVTDVDATLDTQVADMVVLLLGEGQADA